MKPSLKQLINVLSTSQILAISTPIKSKCKTPYFVVDTPVKDSHGDQVDFQHIKKNDDFMEPYAGGFPREEDKKPEIADVDLVDDKKSEDGYKEPLYGEFDGGFPGEDKNDKTGNSNYDSPEQPDYSTPSIFSIPQYNQTFAYGSGKVLKGDLKGDVTHFDDNEYQCSEWNGVAKNAMEKGHYFAASNFKLARPKGYSGNSGSKKSKKGKKKNKRGQQKYGDGGSDEALFELKCEKDGGEYLCARIEVGNKKFVEYQIIDWCDPNGYEQCTEFEVGHIDILVSKETKNWKCTSGCEGYKQFSTSKSKWDLVVCSNPARAKDFVKDSKKGYTGDNSAGEIY